MWALLLIHAWRHAELAIEALAIASALGAPLGVLAASAPVLRSPILGLAAIGRTLPSIALLMLLLPLLGVGAAPAIVALTLLALAPIIINVELALSNVDRAALDAATGLGMSPIDRFARISIPLALPLAIAGIRTASVEVIGSATLATFIGAGGLGDDIVRSMQTSDLTLLLASCATVAAMAWIAELLFTSLASHLEVAR